MTFVSQEQMDDQKKERKGVCSCVGERERMRV